MLLKKQNNEKTLFLNLLPWFFPIFILIPKNLPNILKVLQPRLLFLVFMLVIFAFEYIKNKKKYNKLSKFATLSIILYYISILFMLPSIFNSKSIFISIYTICKFALFGTLPFMLLKSKIDKDTIIKSIKSLILSCFIIMIIGIIQYIFKIDLLSAGVEKYPEINGRLSITFLNPIYLTVFVNTILFILIFVLNKNKNYKMDLLLSITIIGLLICSTFAFSRSGIIILILDFIFLLIFNFKSFLTKKTIIIFFSYILIILSIPGSTYVYKNSIQNTINMLGINFSKVPGQSSKPEIDTSIDSRGLYNSIGKEVFKEYKYTGVGAGAYINYAQSKEYKQKFSKYKEIVAYPHSSLILLLAETGIFSTILFFTSIIMFTFDLVIYWLKQFLTRYDSNNFHLLTIILVSYYSFIIVTVKLENLVYDTQIMPIILFTFFIFSNYLLDKLSKLKKSLACK